MSSSIPAVPVVWSWKDPLRRLLGWPTEQEAKNTEWRIREELVQKAIAELSILRSLTSYLCYSTSFVCQQVIEEVCSQVDVFCVDTQLHYSMPLDELREASLNVWFDSLQTFKLKCFETFLASLEGKEEEAQLNVQDIRLKVQRDMYFNSTLCVFHWKHNISDAQEQLIPLAHAYGVKLWKDEVVKESDESVIVPITNSNADVDRHQVSKKIKEAGLLEFGDIKDHDEDTLPDFLDAAVKRFEASEVACFEIQRECGDSYYSLIFIPYSNLESAIALITDFNALRQDRTCIIRYKFETH